MVSARSVARELDPERYHILPMAIDRAGRWATAALAREVLQKSGDRADQVLRFTGSLPLDPRLLDGSADVVMPILHGPFGEDGTIQGLCEVLNLPYVGCNVAASAVTMDKVLTKRLLKEAGLPVTPFASLTRCQWEKQGVALVYDLIKDLGLPLFVKPARLGSSVGISKVKSQDGLPKALEEAFRYDDVVVLERAVPAREIEVAVLGGDPPLVSVPGEVVPSHEFYDYADKYLDDACSLLAPAPLDEGSVGLVQDLALQAFFACGCDAMARVDFLLDRHTGEFFVNELNSIPGFTPISMYPRLLGLSGLPYRQLLDRLVELALVRFRRRAELGAGLKPGNERECG